MLGLILRRLWSFRIGDGAMSIPDKEKLPPIISFRLSTSRSILSCVTFAYRCVVAICRWPMILLTVSIGIPCDRQIILPKVCRA